MSLSAGQSMTLGAIGPYRKPASIYGDDSINRASSRLSSGLPADVRWMNRLSSLMVGLLLVGFLFGLLYWLSGHPYFALRGVSIKSGVERVSLVAMRANVGTELRGNFFSIDLEKAQKAFETTPWVRRAALRRVWPNRLEVEIQEHQPVAIWIAEDEPEVQKLVNNFGEVFEVNMGEIAQAKLPTLIGPAHATKSMLAMLQNLSQALSPLKSDTSQLILSSRGSWRAVLINGVVLELGRGQDAEVLHRTTQFVATVPDVINHYDRPLLAVDLRHQKGYVIKLKGVSTTVGIEDKSRLR